ncbi:MAG: polyphenol oxidase family protein [Acidimicrobiales bacterium]|nr:polyphenol oxidase family protein [Acidimicrobiales bacterium]
MATLQFSERAQGDFRIDGDPDELRARRDRAGAGDWTWLRQVHGARVVTVTSPGEHAGAEADAAVSAVDDAVLAIHTADCAPVLFHSAGSDVVGAAHAGWRGLVDGVLEATVAAMVDLGADRVIATVGPHIRARCYEFGADELDQVAERYGDSVRATTAWETPALDLGAGVRVALERIGAVVRVVAEPGCTACEPERYFSHRARADSGRHAATIRRGH